MATGAAEEEGEVDVVISVDDDNEEVPRGEECCSAATAGFGFNGGFEPPGGEEEGVGGRGRGGRSPSLLSKINVAFPWTTTATLETSSKTTRETETILSRASVSFGDEDDIAVVVVEVGDGWIRESACQLSLFN